MTLIVRTYIIEIEAQEGHSTRLIGELIKKAVDEVLKVKNIKLKIK